LEEEEELLPQTSDLKPNAVDPKDSGFLRKGVLHQAYCP